MQVFGNFFYVNLNDYSIFIQKYMLSIHENYQKKAGERENEDERQLKKTNQLLKFNNWIKSVLISQYTRQMCTKLQNILDLPKGSRDPILNVLDIGCGRGQDILKWKLARVRYMVASDFSEECMKAYQERWRSFGQPYRLYLVTADFTKLEMYNKIEHAFYDIVSAQFCLHYMFKTRQDLNYGLANILSNLLEGGIFIATIPDSYTIMRKINQKGKFVNGFTYYGNKYFSLKFPKTKFTEECGNQYGFYLQDAVGSKNPDTGQILYTNQWLISLDVLQKILQKHGVKIEYTKNFLEFYAEHREKQNYRQLFSRMGLIFDQGKSIDPDLWQIAHLYRVLVCRKFRNGCKLNQYNLDKRLRSYKGKQIPRSSQDRGDRGRSHHHYNNNPHYRDHSGNNNRGRSNSNYHGHNNNSQGKNYYQKQH